MSRLFRLAIVTALATYALIVLGGITRVSGSGMGCADDWPRCHGRWLPLPELTSIIEYLHRLVAASIGALVLATAIGTLLVATTSRRTRAAAWAAAAIVVFQGLLGAITVWWALPAEIVTAHLGTAMIFLGLTMLTAFSVALDRGGPAWLITAGRAPGIFRDRRFEVVSKIGVVTIFVMILSGAAASTTGAALACTSWPFCMPGELIPTQTSHYTWLNLAHRATVALASVIVVWIAREARRRPTSRAIRRLTALTVAVLALQIFLGGAYVMTFGSPWLGAAHLATATLLWALTLAIAALARRPRGEPESLAGTGTPTHRSPVIGSRAASEPGRSSPFQMAAGPGGDTLRPVVVAQGVGGAVRLAPVAPIGLRWPDAEQVGRVVRDYVTLTKPGILTLLLVTTLAAMLIAAESIPPFALIFATMLGGVLAAGGANVINCYLDRDIDAIMPRTRHRATVSGRIRPGAVLGFGITLSTLAVLELGLLVNWLAAGLALAGNLFYVFVYTKWLKRRTPQNIVIGGAAGAVPPLVGWAAVTGSLDPVAWALFAIIFVWTPPHFWALALLKQGEYGRAAVPMLPVVAGEAATRRQIVLYSVALCGVCVLLAPLGLGPIYLVAALGLNGFFLVLAVRLFFAPSKKLARQLFFYSLWYLALIFAAAVVDRLVLG